MNESFDPRDFLSVAIEICAEARTRSLDPDPPEAWVRTAAGRAYYGLYLVVRSAIAGRHGVSVRSLSHGAVIANLQHSRLRRDARAVGRHLEYLYAYRRRADYELVLEPGWRDKFGDADAVMALAIEANRLAVTVPHLDFSPIVHLF
jgi:hypothetical protein